MSAPIGPTPAPPQPAFTLYDPVTDQAHTLTHHQSADGQVIGHISAVLTVEGERRPVLISVALGPLVQLTPEPAYAALSTWLTSVSAALSLEVGTTPVEPDPGFCRS